MTETVITAESYVSKLIESAKHSAQYVDYYS